MLLTEMNTDVALDWIERRRPWKPERSGVYPSANRASLRIALETFIADAPVEFSYRCIDPEVALLGKGVLTVATTFARNHDVRAWVSQKNKQTRCGCAID